MRAWAVVETGKPLQEIELPTPEPTGEQVLLEVTHAGVCHSDLHIWEGEYDLGSRGKMRLTDRGVVLPLAMGHEIVGRVVKLGPEAEGKGVKVGETRLVYPWVGCGKCDVCRADEENMCLAPRSLGVYQNGGYATHVLATSWRHLVDISGVDPALAATYACSGVTVYSAINKAMPMPPDEPIVLVGAGGLGMNAIAILKALGHRRICVVDVATDKLDAAKAARRDGHRAGVRRGHRQADHGSLRRPGRRGDRPGQRHPDRALRLRRAPQGRQADPGRVVRRRDEHPVAADADPRPDGPGQLCRQRERAEGAHGHRQEGPDPAHPHRDGAAAERQLGAQPAARRQGRGTGRADGGRLTE